MKLFLLYTAHQEKPWIHPVLCEFPAKGRERERQEGTKFNFAGDAAEDKTEQFLSPNHKASKVKKSFAQRNSAKNKLSKESQAAEKSRNGGKFP